MSRCGAYTIPSGRIALHFARPRRRRVAPGWAVVSLRLAAHVAGRHGRRGVPHCPICGPDLRRAGVCAWRDCPICWDRRHARLA